jgi:trimeric autotransporter adhesin
LNVSALTAGTPTFSIAVSNPSLTVNPNDTAVFNGTLTASGGYNNAVNLQCSGAVPLTCRPSPATLTPTAAGAPFTVTTSNDTQNHFNFTIDATGTDAAHIHQSTPVELIVGFNFAINNDSPAQTISAGQTASYNLDVAPLGNGSVFPGNVTLSCSSAGLPPLSTCTFTPSQVASGQGDTNVLLAIVTTAASPAISKLGSPHLLWYDVGLTLAGIVMAFAGGKNSGRRRKQGVQLAILTLLLGILVACGGGSSGGAGGGASGAGHPGTTPGSYTITVNGAVGSVTRTAEVALTVQ